MIGVGLGVCSWSLRPRSARQLGRLAQQTGVACVQLALKPFRVGGWHVERTRRRLDELGLTPRSGMTAFVGEDYATLESIRRTGGLRPDEHWDANLAVARADAALAASLALPLVSFHAGFLPERRGDPLRAVMLERLAAVADVFAGQGVDVALETGQERAGDLGAFLEDLADLRGLDDVGVNFDPANMLLYGMGDPVEALDLLAPRVRQVHIKDARRATTPGEWGREVPVGDGEVDWPAFFGVLARHELGVDLMIEREAGERRVEEIALARQRVAAWLAAPRA